MSSDEVAFLAAIRASPVDDTARLVYADWLDEHDEPDAETKSHYLRLEVQLGSLPKDSPERARLILRLRKLAGGLPLSWKSAVAKVPIENCDPAWEFACPQGWDNLRSTEDPGVRFCSVCQNAVRYCDTIADAQKVAAQGGCVAVDLGIRRRPGDLAPHIEGFVTMGIIAPELPEVVQEQDPISLRERMFRWFREDR